MHDLMQIILSSMSWSQASTQLMPFNLSSTSTSNICILRIIVRGSHNYKDTRHNKRENTYMTYLTLQVATQIEKL